MNKHFKIYHYFGTKNWLMKKYHATSQKFYIIVVLALFFNFSSSVLFQPRKEETWLLTQLICLLRKQPHNDFHYRTWNWFCYDNCCCWEFVSKEMAQHFTNSKIFYYFSAARSSFCWDSKIGIQKSWFCKGDFSIQIYREIGKIV